MILKQKKHTHKPETTMKNPELIIKKYKRLMKQRRNASKRYYKKNHVRIRERNKSKYYETHSKKLQSIQPK